MNEELYELYSADNTDLRVHVTNAQILDLAAPLIDDLMTKGMTWDQIKESLKTFYDEPWKDRDQG